MLMLLYSALHSLFSYLIQFDTESHAYLFKDKLSMRFNLLCISKLALIFLLISSKKETVKCLFSYVVISLI